MLLISDSPELIVSKEQITFDHPHDVCSCIYKLMFDDYSTMSCITCAVINSVLLLFYI